MPVSDLTRPAVERAIAEFDAIGREAFLKRYGFGRSRGYYLVYKGERYDSKAIAGVAHRYIHNGSEPMKPSDFSGGERTVAAKLRDLGFVVTEPGTLAGLAIPFKSGALYSRQRDIHERFGGQERGGITTPDGAPFIFLFTGETGNQYGYADGWRSDGVFAYTGEGQRGDMEFVRGNRAIRDHVTSGRDLLLFQATKTKGLYRFDGCFTCAGWEIGSGPDRDGAKRDTIVFHLVPTDEAEMVQVGEKEVDEEEAGEGVDDSFEDLRQRAYQAANAPASPPKDARRDYYRRSADVKIYVMRRAGGFCEACKQPAPFLRKNGTPYLEPHHTKRIADGGPDHPKWVGAICPTCHRKIHHGVDGPALNVDLMRYLDLREADLTDKEGNSKH